jgi:Zn finger protein HypA/HybF involved in hydrogenase expression
MKPLRIINNIVYVSKKKLIIKCKNCAEEFSRISGGHGCILDGSDIRKNNKRVVCPHCNYEYKKDEDYEVLRDERLTFSEAILDQTKVYVEILDDLIKTLFENVSKLKEKIL